MSVDDFFDSPRAGGSPPKSSWNKKGNFFNSDSEQSATRGSVGGNSSATGGKTKAASSTNNKSDSEENDRYRQPRGSSSQGSITKIPTGKSQKYVNERSDSESDSGEEGVTGRSSRTRSSRSSGSRSSSEYSRSTSRSPTRSDKDELSGSNSKQAWGIESASNSISANKENSNQASANRPKTGHERSRQRQGSNSSERDGHSKSHDLDSDGSSSVSDTESTVTDSDMTDVSPLNSPQRQPPSQASSKKGKRVEVVERPDVYSYDVDQRKSRPKSGHADGYQHLLQGDKDSVNLKVLMQAILEMERDKEEQMQNGPERQRKFRVQQAPSMAGSVTSQQSYGGSKKNFSFNNTRVKDIDRENQRLMTQILQQSLKKKKPAPEKTRKPVTANHKITSSAVNRSREQQRIDQENRSMLKRLESSKATKTLQRDELNRELFNTTFAGVPLGVIHAQKSRSPGRQTKQSPYGGRPGSAPVSRRPRSATRSDTSSVMSDASSVATSSSTVKSQRTGAGRGRPKSAHTFGNTQTIRGPDFRAKRPDWESGW